LADSGVVFVFGANTWWRANSDFFSAADTLRIRNVLAIPK